MEKKEMKIVTSKDMTIYPIHFQATYGFNGLLEEISEVTKYIPASSYLGIQMQHHSETTIVFAFTNRNKGLSKEEMDWLFNKDSMIVKPESERFVNLFENHRKLYVIRYKKENVAGLFVNAGSIKKIADFCKMAMQEDVIVRMVFYPGNIDDDPQVLIFLSIPNEISMRG